MLTANEWEAGLCTLAHTQTSMAHVNRGFACSTCKRTQPPPFFSFRVTLTSLFLQTAMVSFDLHL